MHFIKIITFFTIFTASLFAKNDWQQSAIANIQLAVRNKISTKVTEATFKVINPKGEIYTYSLKKPLNEWIKAYFPGDFEEFSVDKGAYKWICIVDKKKIAEGKFFFDSNMNLKVVN